MHVSSTYTSIISLPPGNLECSKYFTCYPIQLSALPAWITVFYNDTDDDNDNNNSNGSSNNNTIIINNNNNNNNYNNND